MVSIAYLISITQRGQIYFPNKSVPFFPFSAAECPFLADCCPILQAEIGQK